MSRIKGERTGASSDHESNKNHMKTMIQKENTDCMIKKGDNLQIQLPYPPGDLVWKEHSILRTLYIAYPEGGYEGVATPTSIPAVMI